MSTRQPWSVAVLAGVIGALLVLGVQFVVDKVDDPTSIDTTTTKPVGRVEPLALDEAIHAAAKVAVDTEGLAGESLKIARIEVAAGNPHITAYRVILEK